MLVSNTYASLAFTICGLAYIFFIILMYINKNKLRLKQNKIFIFLLFITVLSLFSEASYVIVMALYDKGAFGPLTNNLCRVYLYITDVWMFTFIYYILNLGLENLNEEIKEKTKKRVQILMTLIFVGICVYSSTLDLNYTITKSGFYTFGGDASLVNYLTGIVLIVITLIVINIKELNISPEHKRPIFFAILYFIVTTLFEVLTGYDFNILTFQFVFMTATLYFTIESQDNKLISYLEQSNQQAQKADKEKTEFLSNMSHEIRSPMYTILGFNELLLDEEKLTPEIVKQDTQHIYNAGIKLQDLVNNISDISTIESGKAVKEENNYKLKDVILDINTNMNSLIDPNKIQFSITADSTIPNNYLGDGEKITKIITNILKNAIKYTGIGKITLDIKGTKIENEMLKFEIIISNTGHEMKEKDFNIDFDDYVQINNSSMNNIDSTLLGIIISKKLASIIDMDIKFENVTGKGTKYFLYTTQKITDETPIGDVEELLNSINRKTPNTNQRLEVAE